MLYSMADGSATSITAIAAATVVVCSIATYQVHRYTPLLWPQYARVTRKKKIAWCNRIVSAAHVRGPQEAPCMTNCFLLLCAAAIREQK